MDFDTAPNEWFTYKINAWAVMSVDFAIHGRIYRANKFDVVFASLDDDFISFEWVVTGH